MDENLKNVPQTGKTPSQKVTGASSVSSKAAGNPSAASKMPPPPPPKPKTGATPPPPPPPPKKAPAKKAEAAVEQPSAQPQMPPKAPPAPPKVPPKKAEAPIRQDAPQPEKKAPKKESKKAEKTTEEKLEKQDSATPDQEVKVENVQETPAPKKAAKSKAKKEKTEPQNEVVVDIPNDKPEQEQKEDAEEEKAEQKPLDEEEEIARLQCEDDENAGALIDDDDIIEKSYKAGLSDQDRQRQKKKMRRLLLLLLLLLLFAGTVSATYFIIKNRTEYVPEFYDNVAIDITRIEFNYNYGVVYPGSELKFLRPLSVMVNADTEEIKYDIVALGVRVTAVLNDTGEDCSDIIDVHFCDPSQVYVHSGLEMLSGDYIHSNKDLMIYYKKVLEAGDSELLIDGFRINGESTDQERYANENITIKVEVFAVYPNPVQIRTENSEFKDAPQGWVDEVYEKMEAIFKQRAKDRGLFG